MRHIILPLFLMLLSVLNACSNITKVDGSSADANPSGPEVTQSVVLESSEIFSLYSATYDQSYRVRIKLPASYQSNTTKRYPVIIKVDGQWDFLLAASAYNCLYFDGQMPETIFIGVDWGDLEGNIHKIRSRDLLPSPVSYFEGSGQAKTFIDVMQQELFPALEERYRLNGQRFLLGGSWGAVFSTYALLERPEFFAGAIAIGADYAPFEAALDALIDKKAGSRQLAGRKLYLGVGQYDAVAPSVLRLADKLENAELKGFDMKLNYLEGFGHSGMNIPGYAGGYQFMFERPSLTLSPENLAKFTGTYREVVDATKSALDSEGERDKLTISMDGDRLVAEGNNTAPLTLTAQAENRFYHPGFFYNLDFEGDRVSLETFFGVTIFERVEG